MRTLLGERFAPITSSIGYLELGFDDVTEAMTSWHESLASPGLATEELEESFPGCLCRLEPLVGGARPRELVVETQGAWTAYFDCGIRGPDAVSVIGHLSSTVACRGLAIRAVPHTVGQPGIREGRLGAVQFELFGPVQTEWLNYVRTVSVVSDGKTWRFDEWGTPQDFEETEQYKARRVRERLTSDMLERYCEALGIQAFDPNWYGPRAFLLQSEEQVPAEGLVMSLQEAQQWLEIVPGMAERLPG